VVFRNLIVGLLCAAAVPACVRGDVLISFQGSTIPTGGTGLVDVFISSNAPVTAPDIVDSFSVKFRITPQAGSVSSGLQFIDPQSDSQLQLPHYIYNGNSLFAPGPVGAVSTASNTNDTYIAGDATFDGQGRSLDINSTPLLLFRLDLSAATAANGDRFSLEMLNDPATSFLDTGFSQLSIDSSSYAPLTLTAVPEPGSVAVILTGTVAAAIRHRRRKRAALPVKVTS
jgi:hypothetical protein